MLRARPHPWLLVALIALVGCGDDSAESGSASPEPRPAGGGGEPTAGAESPRAGETTRAEPSRDPLADAFDVRLARVQPEAHVGEERTCAVAFAERLVDVGPRERTRYPVEAVRRVAVRCAAESGWGWADLVFTADTRDQADQVRSGRVVRARVVAPDGGFGDYVVLEHLELGPTFEPPTPPEPADPPEPAFDFGRAADPGVLGSTRRCAVDFTGPIERVDDRDRRVHGYPDDASHRIALKCLHEGGDAWVDLVLGAAEAPRALAVERGVTLPLELLTAEGGYGGRPVARLGEEPEEGP